MGQLGWQRIRPLLAAAFDPAAGSPDNTWQVISYLELLPGPHWGSLQKERVMLNKVLDAARGHGWCWGPGPLHDPQLPALRQSQVQLPWGPARQTQVWAGAWKCSWPPRLC